MESHLPQSEAEYAFVPYERVSRDRFVYPALVRQHVRGCSDHLSDKCWEGNVNGHHMEIILGSCHQARYHWSLPPEERAYLTTSKKLDVVTLRSLEVDMSMASKVITSIGIGQIAQLPVAQASREDEFYKSMLAMGLTSIRANQILFKIREGVLETTAMETGQYDDNLTDAINDSLSDQDEEDELDVEDEEHAELCKEQLGGLLVQTATCSITTREEPDLITEGEETMELLSSLPELTSASHSEYVPSVSTGIEPNSAVSLAKFSFEAEFLEFCVQRKIHDQLANQVGEGITPEENANLGHENEPKMANASISYKPGEHQAFDVLSEKVLDRSRRAIAYVHLVDPKERARLGTKSGNGAPD